MAKNCKKMYAFVAYVQLVLNIHSIRKLILWILSNIVMWHVSAETCMHDLKLWWWYSHNKCQKQQKINGDIFVLVYVLLITTCLCITTQYGVTKIDADSDISGTGIAQTRWLVRQTYSFFILVFELGWFELR